MPTDAQIEALLDAQEKAAIDTIRKVAAIAGTDAAMIYVTGAVMGIAEFLISAKGRRKAYEFFQGFADDIVNDKLPPD